MARGSMSQPDSPITIRHPERQSIVLDGSNATEKRESRSESSSATLLEMDMVNEPRKLNYLDIEKQVEDGSRPKVKLGNTRARLTLWMTLNTVATVAIVFTNKAIFDDPTFRHSQVAFATFHLFITALTLYILSRPYISLFVPNPMRLRPMLPLAMTMCLNVIFQNLSLTYSSITFYQIARILFTPMVALINFLFYQKSIPRNAAYTLLPMCLGVFIISYYEPKSTAHPEAEQTSLLSVFLALTSVFIGSIYTVWIASYQRKYEMNGFQLLYNQAPIGGVMLMVLIPWTDKLPVVQEAPVNKWLMILLSGGLAALINLSQFFIIAGAGAVSSTVVGHVKTCAIVALGWIISRRPVTDRSAFGVILAITSIIM
ncbi:MAG: hypothetical protein L6R38_001005 [Xanthoria sp. 2 TBL-2021]|nr:MAG: hypothetical protein L6R38_001005 [Xanthoria sp. 2 TBL-2021]